MAMMLQEPIVKPEEVVAYEVHDPKPDKEKRKYSKKSEKEVIEKGSKKRTATCPICGKKGHTRKTCTQKEYITIDEDKLTESEFESIKTAGEHNMSVPEIAKEIGQSLSRVNKALQSGSYEAYLKR